METYTISEAAELTGLTEKSVRNRVDRGQLRVVKREGLRRIPRSELKRAGLIREEDPAEGQRAEGGGTKEAAVVGELLDRLERQANQLGELRALTRQAESLRQEHDELAAALENAREEARQARMRVVELEAHLESAANSRPSPLDRGLAAGRVQLRRLQQSTLAQLRRAAARSRSMTE